MKKFYNGLSCYGKKSAIIEESGRSITYEQLDSFCKEMGTIVSARTLVFLFCENSIDAIKGYVAFLQNEIVPLLLDVHMEMELRENLISIYEPEYLYLPNFMEREIKADYPEIQIVLREETYFLGKLINNHKVEMNQNLALLLTTSGSTGSPKLVRQSYDNIQVNAESIAEYLKIKAEDRPITTLPMNYTYGLSIINSHLLKGATILATNTTLVQRKFWLFFKEKRATTFGGVPYTYEILKKIKFMDMDLPSLEYMTQAGGKLLPNLHKEFAEYAVRKEKKFIVMYGQCEATARMAYLPAEKSLDKYGSMGIAIPKGRLELIDVNGNIITEPETVGELVYYGPNVTLGYALEKADLKKGDERRGRLETGDMAKRDADGYYFIVGRKKRFLKIYGNRINLDEAERMIKQFFGNVECACTGEDDRMCIYVKDSDEILNKNVQKFMAERTGLNPKAFEVYAIDEIPKNEAGKVLYTKLQIK